MGSERQERRKSKTRQSLLDAALRLFAERGIYTPSIEEITEGADLGKGTFYKYFAAREDLIAALVNQGIEALVDRVAREVEGDGEGTGGVVRNIFSAHARFYGERPEYLLLFHQARGWLKLPGSAGSPVRREFVQYVKRLSEILDRKVDSCALSEEGRWERGLILAGLVSGVLSFQYILGDKAPMGTDPCDEIEGLCRTLVR